MTKFSARIWAGVRSQQRVGLPESVICSAPLLWVSHYSFFLFLLNSTSPAGSCTSPRLSCSWESQWVREWDMHPDQRSGNTTEVPAVSSQSVNRKQVDRSRACVRKDKWWCTGLLCHIHRQEHSHREAPRGPHIQPTGLRTREASSGIGHAQLRFHDWIWPSRKERVAFYTALGLPVLNSEI